jgi:hypothetical protein
LGHAEALAEVVVEAGAVDFVATLAGGAVVTCGRRERGGAVGARWDSVSGAASCAAAAPVTISAATDASPLAAASERSISARAIGSESNS